MEDKINELVMNYADENNITLHGAKILVFMELAKEFPAIIDEMANKNGVNDSTSKVEGIELNLLLSHRAELAEESNTKGCLTLYQAMDVAQLAISSVAIEIRDKYSFIPPEERARQIARLLELAVLIVKFSS